MVPVPVLLTYIMVHCAILAHVWENDNTVHTYFLSSFSPLSIHVGHSWYANGAVHLQEPEEVVENCQSQFNACEIISINLEVREGVGEKQHYLSQLVPSPETNMVSQGG